MAYLLPELTGCDLAEVMARKIGQRRESSQGPTLCPNIIGFVTRANFFRLLFGADTHYDALSRAAGASAPRRTYGKPF
jgi:hypothetical protein